MRNTTDVDYRFELIGANRILTLTAAEFEQFRAKFLEGTERQGDCLIWKKGVSGEGCGYGNVHLPPIVGGQSSPHRLSWVLAHGRPIPPKMDVCHQCHERLCVEPTHLQLGSRSQNMRMSAEDGRTSAAPSRRTKLLPADDEAIWFLWSRRNWTLHMIAETLDVTPTTIRAARTRHEARLKAG